MLWYAIMVAALVPLLALNWRRYRAAGWRVLWKPKVRVWWTVMGSSLVTYIYQSPPFYLGVCLLGAAMVMAYPMTAFQRFIGWIYIAMAGLNLGYLLGEFTDLEKYLSATASLNALWSNQVALGWAMLAAYLIWIGYDGIRGNRISGDIRNDHTANPVEPSP